MDYVGVTRRRSWRYLNRLLALQMNGTSGFRLQVIESREFGKHPGSLALDEVEFRIAIIPRNLDPHPGELQVLITRLPEVDIADPHTDVLLLQMLKNRIMERARWPEGSSDVVLFCVLVSELESIRGRCP